MANKNTEKLNKLYKELYSRKGIRPRKRAKLKKRRYGIATDWEMRKREPVRRLDKKKKPRIPSSFFKKFFVGSLIFFVAALVFAVVVYRGGVNVVSSKNIDINVLGSSFIPGGEELPLQIEVINRNPAALEFSDLLLEYPRGDVEGDFERIRRSLGTVGAGKTKTEIVKLVLFGEEGSTKEIRIALEYRVKGSNAIFVKETKYEVAISSSPLTLSLDAPDEVVSGQVFSLKASVMLNTDEPVEDLELKADYPPGFEFQSASPEPVLGTNIWDLSTLKPGEERSINILGKVVGQAGEERAIKILSGQKKIADPSEIEVVFSSLLQTVTIVRPFIEARILVGGEDKEEYAVHSQEEINAQIAWSNNLPVRVDNVEITASISGNALDKNTVEPRRGFYDSSTSVITWNQNTLSPLASIEPGESGTLDFSFASRSLLSGTDVIPDPQIEIEVSISGREAAGVGVREVSSIQKKVVKIITDLQVAAKALYHSGPITNTGPLPPKVGQGTTYGIVWNITNTSSRVSNAQVKATLPVYIDFTGVVSPQGEDVTFDDFSREVIWKVGTIERGSGILTSGREAAFQIRFTPSSAQVGDRPDILGESVLSGRDTFADVVVESRKRALDTNLINDPGFAEGEARVVQ